MPNKATDPMVANKNFFIVFSPCRRPRRDRQALVNCNRTATSILHDFLGRGVTQGQQSIFKMWRTRDKRVPRRRGIGR